MNKTYLLVFFLVFTAIVQAQYRTDSLNSVYDEQHPTITPDGKTLFYTIANHPNNVGGLRDKGDIWYTKLTDNQWNTPIHAGNVLNNKRPNAVLGFSPDGNRMILHHHYDDDKQGLSISNKKNGKWTNPQPLSIKYFLNRSEWQSGSISSDGSIILLSLESFSTKGSEDLYVIFHKGGNSWSDPQNLGSVVNTNYQEIAPYLAADNKTLFFASNGHADNRGSFDIYRSTRSDDTWRNWTKPVNIGNSINSSGRESAYQYLHRQQQAMYVTTQDSDGYGDIKFYKEKLKIDTITTEPVAYELPNTSSDTMPSLVNHRVRGEVIDATTYELIDAQLHFSDNIGSTTREIAMDQGVFSTDIDSGVHHITIDAKGYISQLLIINADTISQKLQIALLPIKVGETVNLQNVLFEQGTDKLIESSYEELDVVVNMMQNNPEMEIELGGHTDNRGSSKLNFQLSEKRVQAVMKYLQSKGVSKRRIEGKGYGGSRPIASNKNEISRKLNRRVEFKVIKN